MHHVSTTTGRTRRKPWIFWLLAIAAFSSSLGITQPSKGADVTAGAPAPGTLVVDSKGAVVGNFCGSNCVLYLDVQRNGLFVYDGVGLEYTSTNCTGIAYLSAINIPIFPYLIGPGGTSGISATATVYYPALPFRSLLIRSFIQGSTCYPAAADKVDIVGTVAQTALTVVPPLSIR
jgi:hypothetical protein